jgi:septal ring factor EnvC (AmiA/AmiB activator)
MTEEKKNPVSYSDEDLKKLEEDIKKASSEDQRAKVTTAIEETKAKIAEQRRQEELEKELKTIREQQEQEKKAYAEKLEALKREQEENTKKLIEELRNERQSTVSTANPFKETETSNDDLKKKLRNDPEYLKEVDEESRKAFYDHYGIRSL